MKFVNKIIVVLAFVSSVVPFAARAGSLCEPVQAQPASIKAAVTMSVKLQSMLETTQPEAAVLARVGSDVSAQGLKYTHAAIVVRDHPEGRWTVVHQLNHCGSGDSGIFKQGLGAFFLDDPYMLDVLVMIPAPHVQRKLAELVRSDLTTRFHEPSYSLLAHPESTRHQNSNGWLAEIVAIAIFHDDIETASRKRAQRLMRDSGFQGSVVRLSPLQKVGASMFSANIHFDDHPNRDQIRGRFEVVTVKAMRQWLEYIDSELEIVELVAPEKIRYPRRLLAGYESESERETREP